MLGMKIAVSSSQSYCKLLNPLCQIVVCRIFIADRARFTGTEVVVGSGVTIFPR